MNAPFSNLYLALNQRINETVPEIKCTSRDTGQLNAVKPPLLYPALLIDFDNFNFENLAENVQTAKGKVVIRIVVQNTGTDINGTPDEWREKSLAGFELEQKVHHALQGYQPSGFGTLIRTAAETIPRKDNLHVRELLYSISFEDYSCRPETQLTPYTLNLSSEFQQ